MKKNLNIIGAGSYGEAILELANNCGFNIISFYDDNKEKKGKIILGVQVLGTINDLFKQRIDNKYFAVAIGNNNIRTDILEKIRLKGGNTPSLIHSSAGISPYAEIGRGVYIHPKSVIWTRVIIEDDCIISPLSLIAHHSVMKRGSFVSSSSAIGANIIIEEKAFIGIGSTIMTGVKKIGKNSIVGAGSVVIHDVLPNTIVAGVPAKIIKYRDRKKI